MEAAFNMPIISILAIDDIDIELTGNIIYGIKKQNMTSDRGDRKRE
jgi:hypothetical protein